MHDPALEMFPLPALWIEENADDLYDMGLGRDARYAAKVAAKYGGIKFLDEDEKKHGVFYA